MISFVPNTIEETEFRWQEFVRQHGVDKHPDLNQEDFTQSCVVQNSRSNASEKQSFTQSVDVLPYRDGYQISSMPGSAILEYWPEQFGNSNDGVPDFDVKERSAENFGHNIGNPNLWKTRFKHNNENVTQKSLTRETTQKRKTLFEPNHRKSTRRKACSVLRSQSLVLDHQNDICMCRGYHSHTYFKPEFFQSVKAEPSLDFEISIAKTRDELIAANDRHLNICNTFWRPSLSMNQYIHGDPAVEFDTLWPDNSSLKDLLQDGIQNTALRAAISDLTYISVICGPPYMIKCLIDLSLVRIDCQLEDGSGLLHQACLYQRSQVVEYLLNCGISAAMLDKRGNSADKVCHCPQIARMLPAKYQITPVGKSRHSQLIRPSIVEHDLIFRLAESPSCWYDLQQKLQSVEFNVNTECNSQGDFLIHILTQGGICQFPMIMTLIRLQGADIELCNSKGMTPLMLAAREGDAILCDALMCLLCADPDKCNVHTGMCALHYATQNNHVSTVSCLIKRGADFNKEDYNGCRPDDFLNYSVDIDDCREVITLHRNQRCQHLSRLSREGMLSVQNLRVTDLSTVDSDGYTLLMTAASHNRIGNLRVLLEMITSLIENKEMIASLIDGQYFCTNEDFCDHVTGMTALSMAAQKGHSDVVNILLKEGANPLIADANGCLPLHHAVLANHESVVDVFLRFFPLTYKGLCKAMNLSKSTRIHEKLRQAWDRRQEEIVFPELMTCAMGGKADQLYCLLEEGDCINSKSGVGNWPLYLAVENGHLDVVRLLCQRGADVKKRHLPTGSTVLHIAAKMGHLDVLEYLLAFCKSSRGWHGKRGYHKLDINAVNSDNKTVLQIAAEKGYIRMVKTLLANGATTALLDKNGFLFSLPEFGGVWSEVEATRQRHTKLILCCLGDKSKKGLIDLQKTWLPRFDHNLRDRNGDTPLMVACKIGRIEPVKFLLQSAVYPQCIVEEVDGEENQSDVDSGILLTSGYRSTPITEEDLVRSIDTVVDTGHQFLKSEDFSKSLRIEQQTLSKSSSRLESLLSDIDKPKGLSIYHDGMVSHVCAVNLFDGCTALHRCLEGGDNPELMKLLLATDVTSINIQNSMGLTALHLACQLQRKKTLEVILKTEGIDINILTLDGLLAEEMTSNKNIIKIVHKARKGQPVRPKKQSFAGAMSPSIPDSGPNLNPPSTQEASSINFEKVHYRYETLRKDSSKKIDNK